MFHVVENWGKPGDCLFRAVSQGLYGTQDSHDELRSMAVNFNTKQWEDIEWLVKIGLNIRSLEEYRRRMGNPGEYGSDIEIRALATVLMTPIRVFRRHSLQKQCYSQLFNPDRSDTGGDSAKVLFLIYTGNENSAADDDSGHYRLLVPASEPIINCVRGKIKKPESLKVAYNFDSDHYTLERVTQAPKIQLRREWVHSSVLPHTEPLKNIEHEQKGNVAVDLRGSSPKIATTEVRRRTKTDTRPIKKEAIAVAKQVPAKLATKTHATEAASVPSKVDIVEEPTAPKGEIHNVVKRDKGRAHFAGREIRSFQVTAENLAHALLFYKINGIDALRPEKYKSSIIYTLICKFLGISPNNKNKRKVEYITYKHTPHLVKQLTILERKYQGRYWVPHLMEEDVEDSGGVSTIEEEGLKSTREHDDGFETDEHIVEEEINFGMRGVRHFMEEDVEGSGGVSSDKGEGLESPKETETDQHIDEKEIINEMRDKMSSPVNWLCKELFGSFINGGIPPNDRYYDTWVFYDGKEEAIKHAKEDEITMAVQREGNEFLFVNITINDAKDAIVELYYPPVFEVLPDKTCVRFHVFTDLPVEQVENKKRYLSILNLLREGILNLIGKELQVVVKKEDFAIARLQTSFSTIQLRILLLDVVFDSIRSLEQFTGLIQNEFGKTVGGRKENTLSNLGLTFYLEQAALMPGGSLWDTNTRGEYLQSEDQLNDWFDDLLLAPPFIRACENPVKFSAELPVQGIVRGMSVTNITVKLVLKSEGPTYCILYHPEDVILWILYHLQDRRSNVSWIKCFVLERTFNIYFERLTCPFQEKHLHTSYVQINVERCVGYYVCEGEYCRGKYGRSGDSYIVKRFDFIIPQVYKLNAESFVTESTLQVIEAQPLYKTGLNVKDVDSIRSVIADLDATSRPKSATPSNDDSESLGHSSKSSSPESVQSENESSFSGPEDYARKAYYCPTRGRNNYREAGKVRLSESQWAAVWDKQEECVRKRYYTTAIDDAVRSLRFFCALNVNKFEQKVSQNDNKKVHHIKIYCYCVFYKCRNFIIDIFHDPDVLGAPELTVRICSCPLRHEGKFLTRYCSGAKRDALKEELRYVKPIVCRTAKALAADPEFTSNKNTTEVYSMSTYQQMRSEIRRMFDLHPNPVIDLICLQRYLMEKYGKATDKKSAKKQIKENKASTCEKKDETGTKTSHATDAGKAKELEEWEYCKCAFLFSVSSPLKVITLCEHRRTLYSLKKKALKGKRNIKGLTVYLDATGSTVNKIPPYSKDIYVYSLVIAFEPFKPDKEATIVSLSEFYSCDQHVDSIEGWLRESNRYFVENGKKPLAKYIIVDKSAALMQASCQAMNKVPLDVYLKTCYNIITSNGTDEKLEATRKRLCFIILCRSHLGKNFVVKIYHSYPFKTQTVKSDVKLAEYKEIRKFLMGALMLITVTESYETIKKLMRCIFLVLLSSKCTKRVQEAKGILNEASVKKKTEEIVKEAVGDDVDAVDAKIPIQTFEGDSTYKGNPFYKDLKEILTKVVEELTEEDEKCKKDEGTARNSDDKDQREKEVKHDDSVNVKKEKKEDVEVGRSKVEMEVEEELMTKDGAQDKANKNGADEEEEELRGVQDESQVNGFKNAAFAKYLLVNYAHLLPMWSAMLCSPLVHQTNGPAENWFNVMKTDILGGQGRDRINRVAIKTENYVAGQTVLIQSKIPKEGLAGRRNYKKKGKQESADREENESIDVDEPSIVNEGVDTQNEENLSHDSVKGCSANVKSSTTDVEATDFVAKSKAVTKEDLDSDANNLKGESTVESGKDRKKMSTGSEARDGKEDGSSSSASLKSVQEPQDDIIVLSDDDSNKDASILNDSDGEVVIEDAYDPLAKEFWKRRPSKAACSKYLSECFLKNYISKFDKKHEGKTDVPPTVTVSGAKCSRRSMEFAMDRRNSGHLLKCDEDLVFEDLYLDYLDSETLVMKHISFYEILEDKYRGSSKLKSGLEGDYPVARHVVPNRRTRGMINDSLKKLPRRLMGWSDFRRLMPFSPQKNTDEFWLTNFLIDAILIIFGREIYSDFGKSVRIFDCETGRRVTRGGVVAPYFATETLEEQIKFVIIPFGMEDHWRVIIADIRRLASEKICCYWYLDPFGRTSSYSEPSLKARHTWQTFISQITPGMKGVGTFKRLSIKHVEQNDSFNCGVFIIYFVQCFLKQRGHIFRIGSELDTDAYRRYLSMTLLHHSKTLNDVCISCLGNANKENNQEWVQCDYCCRWFHANAECLANESIDFKEFIEQKCIAEFICTLCRSNADRYEQVSRRKEIISVQKSYEKYLQWEENDESSAC